MASSFIYGVYIDNTDRSFHRNHVACGMTNFSYTLDDKYTKTSGRVFLTGTQALVRIALDQRRRDKQAGLNTAGFISGYRGSPLGSYDLELWRAKSHIKDAGVDFLPAVNEDLAATAILGTQQVETDPDKTVDGGFRDWWYGQGAGHRQGRRRA